MLFSCSCCCPDSVHLLSLGHVLRRSCSLFFSPDLCATTYTNPFNPLSSHLILHLRSPSSLFCQLQCAVHPISRSDPLGASASLVRNAAVDARPIKPPVAVCAHDPARCHSSRSANHWRRIGQAEPSWIGLRPLMAAQRWEACGWAGAGSGSRRGLFAGSAAVCATCRISPHGAVAVSVVSARGAVTQRNATARGVGRLVLITALVIRLINPFSSSADA